MKFVIVTGMSGAGRNTAMKMMEDIGFYCIDNLPIQLLDQQSADSHYKRREQQHKNRNKACKALADIGKHHAEECGDHAKEQRGHEDIAPLAVTVLDFVNAAFDFLTEKADADRADNDTKCHYPGNSHENLRICNCIGKARAHY